jgi:hypothetical protein
VTPSFDLRSEWLNHSLRVLASGTLGWYCNAPTQNYQNYGILVDGKVDGFTRHLCHRSHGFRRSTEALGTPNVAFSQAPTVVDTLPVEIGLYQQFNRVFYLLSARATRFWYYDYSTISSLGLPGSSRDRFEYGENLKIGYQLFEDVDLFVGPNLSKSATSSTSTPPARRATPMARTSRSVPPGGSIRSASWKGRSAINPPLRIGLRGHGGVVVRPGRHLDRLRAAHVAALYVPVDQ